MLLLFLLHFFFLKLPSIVGCNLLTLSYCNIFNSSNKSVATSSFMYTTFLPMSCHHVSYSEVPTNWSKEGNDISVLVPTIVVEYSGYRNCNLLSVQSRWNLPVPSNYYSKCQLSGSGWLRAMTVQVRSTTVEVRVGEGNDHPGQINNCPWLRATTISGKIILTTYLTTSS